MLNCSPNAISARVWGYMENLDRNILIPNNWDLKGILPARISKIGIKQHLLIENVHGTSFVAVVTHQCKQVESSVILKLMSHI